MDNKKIIAGILSSGTLVMGGIDASVLNEVPLERIEQVAGYEIRAKQIENKVETILPWKDQAGIKVVYDMVEPTLAERIADKRKKEVITETVDFGDGGFKVDILLNEKPDTNVFCYDIEGAENYDFFYQPPLTQEEIAEGAKRPPEIEGSYAVYHKELKNHRVGRENYATGKVMHIPRPQVWELENEETTKEWADMTYTEEDGLCVTVRQEFLDNANYPVRVDPTFGYTSAGGTEFTPSDQGYYSGQQLEGVNGVITDIQFYGYSPTTARNARFGIYRRQAASGSATIISISRDITVPTTTDWHKSTELSANSYLDLKYWLALQFNGSIGGEIVRLFYDTADSAPRLQGSLVWTTNYRPLNTATPASSTYRMSIYATYNDFTNCAFDTCEYFGTGSYLWTVPTGVSSIDVSCWGGGGGGGDGANTGGGGGGGGAFASTTLSVIPGEVYPIEVGSRGAGGGTSASGSAGATSTFATTTLIAAPGQGGAFGSSVNPAGGAGGLASNSSGTVVYNGGNGGNGNNSGDTGGGGGGAAYPGGNGSNASNAGTSVGGNGASSGSTSGGTGGNNLNGIMGNSSTSGGGGGGGGDNSTTGAVGGATGGGGGGGEYWGAHGGDGQCSIAYTASGGGEATSTDSGIIWFD